MYSEIIIRRKRYRNVSFRSVVIFLFPQFEKGGHTDEHLFSIYLFIYLFVNCYKQNVHKLHKASMLTFIFHFEIFKISRNVF